MDSVLTLTLLLALLLLFLLLHPTKPHRHRLPPSPSSLPLLGHLHHLLTSPLPHHALHRLSLRHGPLIHLHLGQVPTLVASSARLAREILKTHDSSLCSRPQLIAAQVLSFGCSDVTFSPYGPYWRQTRKIAVTELLGSRRVGSFRLVRDQETARLLDSLSAASRTAVDVSDLFFRLANDVLCRVAFGRRFSDVGVAGKKGLTEVLTETQALLGGFNIGDFYPRWGWVNALTGLTGRMERNLEELKVVCDGIIAEHLGEEREGAEEEDFVDRSADLEVPITDDNLKALVLDMFVAGTDTTSATLEWTMTELARNPDVMNKAQQEVRRVAAQTGRRQTLLQESDLQHLHYTKSVIKETLRLHPPVPLLVPRESIHPCKIDGYDVPVGTRVLINTYAIGRDPESWEDPLKFDPERFARADIDVKGGGDFELLPFGGGRRGCPGYGFGLATIEIALARLLLCFDWELPPGVGGGDLDLEEIFGLATRKKVPCARACQEC
ncbi:Cytochrome P450 71A9 [Acorus calamus]|uniref:Cytochrome P450 71A9 n=1 Tax=Acorus calamus TaxID=4465 RepID=A0AAV9F163_ACOCL|nr:Cytochrome P450 71A9 [Acorus calamus]